MGKRDDLIAKYAKDLEEKCGLKPDMKLLTAVHCLWSVDLSQ